MKDATQSTNEMQSTTEARVFSEALAESVRGSYTEAELKERALQYQAACLDVNEDITRDEDIHTEFVAQMYGTTGPAYVGPPKANDTIDSDTLEALTRNDAVKFVTLSNGKRGAVDSKSGQLLFITDDFDDEVEVLRVPEIVEESSEDEEPVITECEDPDEKVYSDVPQDEGLFPELGDSPTASPREVEVPPLVLELHKNQNPEMIRGLLLKATATLQEHKGHIKQVQVVVEGFGESMTNPALHRPAKKRYAKACELGLLGLLTMFGFNQEAMTVYAIAYLKAKVKNGDVIAKGTHMPAAQALFKERMYASLQTYEKLVNANTK